MPFGCEAREIGSIVVILEMIDLVGKLVYMYIFSICTNKLHKLLTLHKLLALHKLLTSHNVARFTPFSSFAHGKGVTIGRASLVT